MIPTLEIIHPDLPGAKMIINEADFDPSRHQRYREPKGRKRSPEQTPVQSEDRSPEPIPNLSEDQPASAPDLSQAQSPEQTPAEPQEQSPLVSDLSEEQSPEQTPKGPEEQPPEPTPDLPEDLSPEQTPNGPEDQPSLTPDLPEAQPATYSQSDLETKNITALRAIAAEKRIPRRMKLSRDELLQAILSTPTPPTPSPANQSLTTSFLTFDS